MGCYFLSLVMFVNLKGLEIQHSVPSYNYLTNCKMCLHATGAVCGLHIVTGLSLQWSS